MRIPAVVFLVLAVTVTADQKCFDGKMGPKGHEMTKEQVVDMIKGQFTITFVKVMESSADAKAFMQSRGQCQLTCGLKLVEESIGTLYGKLGPALMDDSDASKATAVEALTGAFLACFPKPPRKDVHEGMEKIVESMSAGPPSHVPKENPFAHNPKCKNPPTEEHPYAGFPMDDFKKNFGKAFEDTVKATPDVDKFFQTQAKDCQIACLHETIPAAAVTLYMTENTDEDDHLKAATGAAKACFPGVPHKDVEEFMDGVIQTFKSRRDEHGKLYIANVEVQETVVSTPLAATVVGASLIIFFAGAALAKRAKSRRAARLVLDNNELDGLEDHVAPE